MSKMRVHELAKELGLSSKETIEKLSTLGVVVKSHASSVSDDEVARLKESLNGGAPAAPAPKAPKAEKAAPPEPAEAAPAQPEPPKAEPKAEAPAPAPDVPRV